MNLPISLVIENKQRKKPMGTTQEEIYQRKRMMRFFFHGFRAGERTRGFEYIHFEIIGG